MDHQWNGSIDTMHTKWHLQTKEDQRSFPVSDFMVKRKMKLRGQ